jgi:hypothetical protein
MSTLQSDFPKSAGPYLGQKPPGLEPETGFFNKNQDIFGFGFFTMTKQSMS